MTSRTHDLAAFTALNLITATQILPHLTLSTVMTAIGANFLGGLAPDLDKPTSEFWQKFPAGSYLGHILHTFLGGHRLISHSVIGFVLFGLLSKYILSLLSHTIIADMNIVWIAFMIGYFSHLLMDMLTSEGIPLFFPIPVHIGFPPFKILRIKTGGLIEKAIIFPLLLIANGYLFYHFYPTYIHLLKTFIK